MKNNVIVVSLPRTGTTSICRMLEILGYKSYHAPLDKINNLFYQNTGRAFSDTPCFAPSIFNEFLKQNKVEAKFIYLERDFDSWFDSMTKSTNLLRTQHNLMKIDDSKITKAGLKIDKKYYHEVFGDFDYFDKEFKSLMKERFYEHRNLCLSNDWCFKYKFSDGWKPLCDYLQVNIPNEDIPHLHNVSMRSK